LRSVDLCGPVGVAAKIDQQATPGGMLRSSTFLSPSDNARSGFENCPQDRKAEHHRVLIDEEPEVIHDFTLLRESDSNRRLQGYGPCDFAACRSRKKKPTDSLAHVEAAPRSRLVAYQ
jgi:hypothetical protein